MHALIPDPQDALESNQIDVSANPYINIANDTENTWLEVSDRIGKELFAAGSIETASASSSGARPDFYGTYRARSSRLKRLGWAATEKEDVLDSIAADVAAILGGQVR